jgi:hypothetical protein
VKLLLCGSSHRPRGSGGWTLPAPVADLLRVLQPNFVAHGDSPAGGLDEIADGVARGHFGALGIDPEERVCPYPMLPHIDGSGRRAFIRRNARMCRDFGPDLGAAFVVGRVGQCVGTNGNYLSNGAQSTVDWLHAHRVPVVVFREDGLEPCDNVNASLAMLRRLYAVTRDERLVPPGKALRAFAEISEVPVSREEVLTALACTREGARWAAWIEAVERAVRAGQ